MDTYKSKDDKNIEKRGKIKYREQVQDLLELIPTVPVFKQDLTTSVEGVVFPAFKWTVNNEYTIHSDFHRVFTIEADDVEVSYLTLNQTDYKKVIAACEVRDKQLHQERQNKR